MAEFGHAEVRGALKYRRATSSMFSCALPFSGQQVAVCTSPSSPCWALWRPRAWQGVVDEGADCAFNRRAAAPHEAAVWKEKIDEKGRLHCLGYRHAAACCAYVGAGRRGLCASPHPDPPDPPDLVAQQDTICVPAMVKIHPTLQLAIDKETLFYDDSTRSTKRETDLAFTIQVKSNLPFRKQMTMTPFKFTPNGVPGDILQTYKYVNGAVGARALGHGRPRAPTRYRRHDPDQSRASTSPRSTAGPAQLVRPEAQVPANGVYPGDGSAIGDIDNHVFEDKVRWHVGPIKWCDTAGYYVGQMCVTVYQN